MITKAQIQIAKDLRDTLSSPLWDSTKSALSALIAVGEKLADGHVIVPIEPDAGMLQTADDVLKAIYQDDHQRSEVSYMWMKVHRAVTRAMIAADK